MNRNSIITTINQLGALASQHLPVILGAVGTVMTVGAVVSAVDTVPKVPEKIQEKKNEEGRDLTLVEKGAVVAKTCHTPLALTVGSVACNWAAIGISAKRISALSALYLLEKSKSDEFKEATKKIVKTSDWEKIKTAESEAALEKHPFNEIKVQGDPNGEFLWFDDFTGRYFRASIAQISQAFATYNTKLYSREWMCLNDLFELFPKYEPSDVGNYLGYDLVAMREKCSNPRDAIVNYDISDHKLAITGEPCRVLKYTKPMPLEAWRNWDAYDNQFNYMGI